MQDSIGVEILEAEEDLVEVSDDDALTEDSVLVQETGDAAPRHPLHEDVDVRALLYGPVHPHHVGVTTVFWVSLAQEWQLLMRTWQRGWGGQHMLIFDYHFVRYLQQSLSVSVKVAPKSSFRFQNNLLNILVI